MARATIGAHLHAIAMRDFASAEASRLPRRNPQRGFYERQVELLNHQIRGWERYERRRTAQAKRARSVNAQNSGQGFWDTRTRQEVRKRTWKDVKLRVRGVGRKIADMEAGQWGSLGLNVGVSVVTACGAAVYGALLGAVAVAAPAASAALLSISLVFV
jgi:hypothetical protein